MSSIENLQTAKSTAFEEIATQVSTGAALDAKLVGLLAFMAAAVGVLLTVAHGLATHRWILLVGAAGASVLVLIGSVGAADLKSGPRAIDFYKRYGGLEPVDYDEQLMADLGKTTIDNEGALDGRRALLTGAFVWAVLWSAAFGIVQALLS
jgi:hypothetical protein